MAEKFTWIKTYEAMADKVYEYRNRRDEFLELFRDIFCPDGSDGKVKFPPNGGNATSYLAVDPFTFFATFNRGRYSEGNNKSRSETIERVIERLGIEAMVPTDYDGVPLSFSMRTWFFDGDPQVIEDGDVDRLWDLFVAAVNYADRPDEVTRSAFVRAFDAARVQKQVKWNITYALFWVRPYIYLGLDSVNRDYLDRNYGIKLTKQPDAQAYLEIIGRALEATGVDIPTLSDNAFVSEGWWPAREVYEPGLSAEDWLGLLADKDTISQNCLAVFARMMDNGGRGSCTALAERYGENKNFYNANISTTAEKVAKKMKCKLPPSRDSGNTRWWPIICVGKYVGGGKTRQYEYRLRPELQEGLKRYDLSSVRLYTKGSDATTFDGKKLDELIKAYKADHHRFRGSTAPNGDQEAYKWERVLNFKKNWNIDAENFEETFRLALRPASVGQGAILGNGWEYPYPRLQKCIAENPEAVRSAFRSLFDPMNDIRQAYESFDHAMGEILDEYNDNTEDTIDSMDQKPSAVSVYLAFKYPERYYIYKPSIADDFSKFVGAKLSSNSVEKFYDFEALCDAVLPTVLYDKELLQLNDSVLSDELRTVDPAHHMLVQDITYYCSRYMNKWAEPDPAVEVGDTTSENREAPVYPKNMILYGPPGTGKTFKTRAYAVAICDRRDVEEVIREMGDQEGRDAVYQRYQELLDKGRVAFTTFHQSYSYEDFIEGIRPDFDDDSGTLRYKLSEGVFRKFCSAAESVVSAAASSNGVPRFESNPSPRVWKMGLTTHEVQDLYDRCRKDGCLRMGWDNVSAGEVEISTDITEANRKAISAFQEEMQPGDFVVSPGGASDEYGVAVVTGEFEWRNDLKAAKRYRTAKWVGDIDKARLRKMNGGKGLTLQTVYELGRISASQLIEELGLVTEAEVKKQERVPYVFIIDEINRANVSKVFGELITLIEDSKRKGELEEARVTLPYSGKDFSVPANVYIIGTMNTADRSIALMDTALRRRFDFVEAMPEPGLFQDLDVEGVDVARMLATMNKRIELLYDREHTIGHAYFMALKDSPTIETLTRIFSRRIVPLLQEYFYDDYGKIASVLGAAARDFIGMGDDGGAFWTQDERTYGGLRSYRLRETPSDPAAFIRIYTDGSDE